MVATIEPGEAGARLDRYLVALCPGWSRSALARLIRAGRVTVNGRPASKAGQALDVGDRIAVELPPAPAEAPAPEERPLPILYEDEDLLVVDKPAGLAVHPGPGHPNGTLVNALLGRDSPLARGGGTERPGIVHRLDKETSGLLLVAKTEAAYESLARQFKERRVEKVYIALLHGRLEPPQGTIEAPLARDPVHRQRMAIVPGGREAVTAYQALTFLDRYTLVEARPQTGRTHQVRVHFAALGHPIVGDPLYTRARERGGRRLFLHAHRLRLLHPVTGRPLSFLSPLPQELAEALQTLAGPAGARLLAHLAPATLE